MTPLHHRFSSRAGACEVKVGLASTYSVSVGGAPEGLSFFDAKPRQPRRKSSGHSSRHRGYPDHGMDYVISSMLPASCLTMPAGTLEQN